MKKKVDELLEAYKSVGGDLAVIKNRNIASLFVRENKIISANTIDGIALETRSTKKGVNVKMRIKRGYHIDKPVHLCFGVIPQEGVQEIVVDMIAERKSSAHLLAHCVFPNAIKVKHIMDARFTVQKDASLNYEEIHFHGDYGGTTVLPRAKITNYGKINTTFTLITGRVGKLEIDYSVDGKKNSVTEILAKVYGKGDDNIRIKEGVLLNGEHARSVIKTRIAVKDHAISDVTNITEGNAPFARGHVDCTEIVQDHAIAKAVPIVSANDERAKITHEAAIGSVDKKQLETLMARGLDEEEAIDVIIRGMLK